MLSIILLTLVVTSFTAPLTVISMRSQRRMAAVQPHLAALRAEHAADPARLQTESMALLREHGVSPIGGCVPMLIQMPVFVLLYRHVRNMAAGGLTFRGVDLAQTGLAAFGAGPAAAFMVAVVVVLLLGCAIVGIRLAPRAQADAASRVVRYMPLAFAGWVVAFPLALGVYYATSSVLRLGVQVAAQRHFGAG